MVEWRENKNRSRLNKPECVGVAQTNEIFRIKKMQLKNFRGGFKNLERSHNNNYDKF